jgi:hypothetical protein
MIRKKEILGWPEEFAATSGTPTDDFDGSRLGEMLCVITSRAFPPQRTLIC